MNETVDRDAWMWLRDVTKSWLEDPGVEEFQGLNMSNLRMDQAYVVGVADRDVSVYEVSDDCFRVSSFIFNYTYVFIMFTLYYVRFIHNGDKVHFYTNDAVLNH